MHLTHRRLGRFEISGRCGYAVRVRPICRMFPTHVRVREPMFLAP